ncbi:hypothetical protein GCM10025867_30340 [Frondihabitans sucicola]|uniref:DUF3071 domain-containing protein n=1 Tax=Frondihabitans sucicola TaxID=1268041 RepID=A0ABN6Y4E1_9MICO|nr:hypothetical protein [Frondihabitans sucicola]BDZ50793.1 hypothetical protein GCM10025867_30340 [Frondihabitans sucicola]
MIDVPLDDFDEPEKPADDTPAEPARTTKPLATHPTASRRPIESRPESESRQPERQKTASGRGRKGRASMPSWDEIVFGARSDDDPA